MNYKIPKNQTQYIPGSNPLGAPSLPNPKGKKISLKQEQMQKQLMKSQEKIMMFYNRRLTKKDRDLLQDFISNQYRVGSPIFNTLPKILKELILKLNLEGVSVMKEYTKNPFMKMYYSFSAWSLKSLLKNINIVDSTQKSKKLKKEISKEKNNYLKLFKV